MFWCSFQNSLSQCTKRPVTKSDEPAISSSSLHVKHARYSRESSCWTYVLEMFGKKIGKWHLVIFHFLCWVIVNIYWLRTTSSREWGTKVINCLFTSSIYKKDCDICGLYFFVSHWKGEQEVCVFKYRKYQLNLNNKLFVYRIKCIEI